MQDRPVLVIEAAHCLVEHVLDQLEDGSPRGLEGDDLAVVQVHDRRQEQLFAGDIELGDIGRPLLVHALRPELTLQQVGCHTASLTLVGPVLLGSDQRLQSHLNHQPLDGLVVDRASTPTDRGRHPTIAVAALVFVEDRADR